jgi:hypothetical protein
MLKSRFWTLYQSIKVISIEFGQLNISCKLQSTWGIQFMLIFVY